MKISKEDYLLLVGMVEFHFKFSEYVREQNEEMFFRAIDYAQTYTKSKGIQFDYWHENNKRFLIELSGILDKKKNSFDKLVAKVGKETATKMWIDKKKTNHEDLLGIKNYTSNFMHHARELEYESFDLEDWMNFVKICKHITDTKFIDFCRNQIKRILGDDHELIKELDQ